MKAPNNEGLNTDNDKPALDEETFSSNRSGVAVPWLLGEGPVSPRWVSPVYGAWNKDAPGKSGGKGGKGGGGKQKIYGGIIVGILGIGPVDTLEVILSNGNSAWQGPISRASSSNPAVFTMPDMPIEGEMRFYWGTETQTADSNLSGYDNHPPYKGICYFVYKGSFGAAGETQPPNFKFYLRASPRQTLIVNDGSTPRSPAAFDGHATVNPMAAAVEVITSQHLGKRPTSEINTASFQAIANSLQNETIGGDPEKIRAACAPWFPENAEIKDIFKALTLVSDITFRLDVNGKIEAMRWYRNAASTVTCTELTWADLTEPPNYDTDPIDALATEVSSEFRDGEHYHKTNGFTAPNPAANNTPGSANIIQKIDAKNILNSEAGGVRLAREQAARLATPGLNAKISVRREKCVNPDGSPIRPGDYVKVPVTLDPQASAITVSLFRVIGREFDPFGPVTLELERELDAPVLPATVASPEPNQIGLAQPPVNLQRMVSLPPLSEDDDASVCPLVCRPSDMAAECAVSYGRSSSGDFQEIGHVGGWALPLRLYASFASGATTVRVQVLPNGAQGQSFQRELYQLTSWQGGTTEGADDQMLIVLMGISGGDVATYPGSVKDFAEVLSINGVASVVSSGVYDVPALRGRLGTSALNFTSGSFPDAFTNYEAWLLPRRFLSRLTHGDFNGLIGTTANAYFQFRPLSVYGPYDPAEAYDEKLRLAAIPQPTKEFEAQASATADVPTAVMQFPYTFSGKPAAPVLLTPQTGLGGAVGLTWTHSAPTQVNEYRIYRTPGVSGSGEEMIATNSSTSFTDYRVTIGSTYYYRVKAEAIGNDSADNGVSDFSNTAGATPSGSADMTTPPTPSAMTVSSSGNYITQDGKIASYIDLNLPALTGNAASVQVMVGTSSNFAAAALWHQKNNTSSIVVRIDDLSPLGQYYVWSQQFSQGGAPSASTAATGSPLTAPGKTSRPGAPSSVTTTAPASGDGFPPSTGAYGIVWGTWITTPAPSDASVLRAEARGGLSAPADNDAIGSDVWPITQAKYPFYYYYPSPGGWTWVRFIDSAGNKSAWTRTSGVTSYSNSYVGNIISESKDDTNLSGLSVSTSGGTPSKFRVIHSGEAVIVTDSSGYANISLPSGVFGYKPDTGDLSVVDPTDGKYTASYIKSSGSNSATNAVIRGFDSAKNPVNSGALRICYTFKQIA